MLLPSRTMMSSNMHKTVTNSVLKINSNGIIQNYNYNIPEYSQMKHFYLKKRLGLVPYNRKVYQLTLMNYNNKQQLNNNLINKEIKHCCIKQINHHDQPKRRMDNNVKIVTLTTTRINKKDNLVDNYKRKSTQIQKVNNLDSRNFNSGKVRTLLSTTTTTSISSVSGNGIGVGGGLVSYPYTTNKLSHSLIPASSSHSLVAVSQNNIKSNNNNTLKKVLSNNNNNNNCCVDLKKKGQLESLNRQFKKRYIFLLKRRRLLILKKKEKQLNCQMKQLISNIKLKLNNLFNGFFKMDDNQYFKKRIITKPTTTIKTTNTTRKKNKSITNNNNKTYVSSHLKFIKLLKNKNNNQKNTMKNNVNNNVNNWNTVNNNNDLKKKIKQRMMTRNLKIVNNYVDIIRALRMKRLKNGMKYVFGYHIVSKVEKTKLCKNNFYWKENSIFDLNFNNLKTFWNDKIVTNGISCFLQFVKKSQVVAKNLIMKSSYLFNTKKVKELFINKYKLKLLKLWKRMTTDSNNKNLKKFTKKLKVMNIFKWPINKNTNNNVNNKNSINKKVYLQRKYKVDLPFKVIKYSIKIQRNLFALPNLLLNNYNNKNIDNNSILKIKTAILTSTNNLQKNTFNLMKFNNFKKQFNQKRMESKNILDKSIHFKKKEIKKEMKEKRNLKKEMKHKTSNNKIYKNNDEDNKFTSFTKDLNRLIEELKKGKKSLYSFGYNVNKVKVGNLERYVKRKDKLKEEFKEELKRKGISKVKRNSISFEVLLVWLTMFSYGFIILGFILIVFSAVFSMEYNCDCKVNEFNLQQLKERDSEEEQLDKEEENEMKMRKRLLVKLKFMKILEI
ncbi:hypothetical protein ABK040_013956 [Willaertia magna]